MDVCVHIYLDGNLRGRVGDGGAALAQRGDYIYTYISIYTHIYIYIERERDG